MVEAAQGGCGGEEVYGGEGGAEGGACAESAAESCTWLDGHPLERAKQTRDLVGTWLEPFLLQGPWCIGEAPSCRKLAVWEPIFPLRRWIRTMQIRKGPNRPCPSFLKFLPQQQSGRTTEPDE